MEPIPKGRLRLILHPVNFYFIDVSEPSHVSIWRMKIEYLSLNYVICGKTEKVNIFILILHTFTVDTDKKV